MAATVLADIPAVARVGFDHGWYLCGPTFLNLGVPLLLVDQLFLPDATGYGLERLGGRNPHEPLPMSTLTVQRSGRYVALHTSHRTEPLTIGAFADPTVLAPLDRTDRVAVTVGDTWAVEQSWCAVFRCSVAIAPLRRFPPVWT